MTKPSIAGGVSFDLASLDSELRKEAAYEAFRCRGAGADLVRSMKQRPNKPTA